MKHFSTQRLSSVFLFFSISLFLFFSSAVYASEIDDDAKQGRFNRFTSILLMNEAEISINKSAINPTILAGNSAEFEITVFNSGTIDIFDIEVTDLLVPACNKSYESIQSDNFEQYRCQSGPLIENMINTVEVFGKYGTTATFTVMDSDQESVEVDEPIPSIKISKTTSTPTLYTGETAVFEIEITNDGDVNLSDIEITDPLTSDCNESFDNLTINATEAYTCEHPVLDASFTNVATVTANAGENAEITDSSSADVTEIELSITIVKTAVTPQVAVGESAEFTIQIQNTSDVQLFNVNIEDPLTSDCEGVFSTLLPNAIRTYSCETGPLTESFTNEATVVARTGDFVFVNNSDTAFVDVVGNHDISLTKTANPGSISIGEVANFDFVIQNIGTLPLFDVSVTDVNVPACSENNLGDLEPGETIGYSCEISGLVNNLTNTATVSAESSSGNEITDSSTVTIFVNNPAVSISVTPTSQTVDFGDPASFEVTVENIGNRFLTSVSVSSSTVSDCNENLANISVNNSKSFTCIAPNVQDDFVNELTVTAIGANQQVEDSTSAIVQVENSSNIVVAVSPSLQTVLLNDDANNDAEFTIFIFNNGTATLNNLEVSSELVPSCARTLSVMPPNFVVDFTCEATNVTSNFINTILVSATPEGSNTTIENTGLAIVDTAGIDFTVTPNITELLSPGGMVSFNAIVTNIGSTNATLNNFTGAFMNLQTDPVNAPLVNNNCQENFLILAGQMYSCSFEIDVSGSSGSYDLEIEANVKSDIYNFSESSIETITILPPPETNIYLPIVWRDRPEEPNDVCTEAYPIVINKQYSFLPDDKNDLFIFELSQNSDLNIQLTNFTPINGQIVLYRGNCTAPIVVANNGNASISKSISAQNQPAGTYIILVVTDGTFSTTPYNLIVNSTTN